MCAEHVGVFAHVKKQLERGWKKTHNVRKEHGALQCAAQALLLSPSLFFKYLPHEFLRRNKGALFTSLPYSLAHPPSCPSFFISKAAFLSFSILSLSFPSPWLFCSIAKMGLQSVALEPFNCCSWPHQYAHLIYFFIYFFWTVYLVTSATVMLCCICWLSIP